MKTSRILIFVLTSVLLAPVIFTGCATSLLYNHADWLITRQIDGYFDLNRSQRSFVTSRLNGILDGHRREALPQYETVLHEAAMRVQRGLTEADVDWAATEYDRLRADLFGRFSTDGADFIRLVNDRQIPYLKQSLQTRLSKEEGLLHDDRRTRLTKRTERILSLTREWLGNLSPAQEQDISRAAMNLPDILPSWYTHQMERNRQLVELVEARQQGDTPGRLKEWLVNQDKTADPEFRDMLRQFKGRIGELLLTIDRLATPEQRRHVIAKLDDLAKTVHGLSHT
ncbi:DUF6279 family lipoprotein [Nitrospira japonica]|uniref:DUF6279 family lipoprotein n=1 Tax=Nitrospira japonica TaxID=1325564 RepID=UPI001E36EBF2|nr:DUF6279 family lipoprotein [Nitrospira japonica]